MKRCRKCKTEKPLSDFHKNGANGDGYHYYCKNCRSDEAKKLLRKKTLARYYQRNKGKSAARAAAVKKYGPAKKFRCAVFGCTLRAAHLHHVCYVRPLDVLPLCQLHHTDSHTLIGDT